MKTIIVIILLYFCTSQILNAQEAEGVIPLSLPVRSSLTFNRYVINPTFSFVREQNKYISIYNKREWVQFEDAPLTLLGSYSGRLAENIGAGLGVFQQNYGVLATFGGVLNFAYNARLSQESNLTFGLNVGAYKSGLNTGSVVTNFDDPSIQNVPESFLLTVNPGINYGMAFLDIGVSVNNLVVYNFENSELMEDNPERGIQAHLMYTGYMNTRGFFDESKFSGLIRSEFKEDETIVSGIAMLTVPKGIWGQVGYNSVYGISGGLGINITPQIAIEYNFEKGIGDLIDFGPSHDITLAYRFKNKENYYYSSGDQVGGLITPNSKRKRTTPKKPSKEVLAKKETEAETEAKRLADQKAKEEADAQAKLLAEQEAKEEAEAKRLAEQKAKAAAESEAKRLADEKAKQEAEAQAKLLAEQKAKEEAEAKRLAEQKAKEEAEAKARAKQLADQKAKEEAEEQARILAEQKAKEEAEAKRLAEQKLKEEKEAEAKLLAEQQAKEEEEAQAKLLAEQQAIDSLINNPKDDITKAMRAIIQNARQSKVKQDELLDSISGMVSIKDQDLKDLKKENDLSEQGIVTQPKPFKNLTEENNRLKAMIANLDRVIKTRDNELKNLRSLYDEYHEVEGDTIYLDEVLVYYQREINRLTKEQIEAAQEKIKLQLELEEIRVAMEFERNRRIKRAAFDNESERYTSDRETLKNIKENTVVGSQVFEPDDFDFGEEQSGNIQILKNVDRTDGGYYVILAVHSDVDKRNDFVTKVYASGRTDVDFFYDVNTSKYYIYYGKYNDIESANRAMQTKGSKPYNTNMSLVKIEN